MDSSRLFSLFVCLSLLLSLETRAGEDADQRQTSTSDVGDKPQIITSDGNLIFQTGLNNNITFKTADSGGTVFLDFDDSQTDLKSMLNTMQDTIDQMNQMQSAMAEMQTKISGLEATTTSLQTQINDIKDNTGGDGGGGSGPDSPYVNDTLKDHEGRISSLETSLLIIEENECLSNPCSNSGTCIDLYDGYLCHCPANWQGLTCTQDVDECTQFAGSLFGCQNGATCINTEGSYRCECPPNFYGVHCTETHDDCTDASNEELCGHGQCLNQDRQQPDQPNYVCLCYDGWDKDPASSSPACTLDINECQSDTYPCSHDPYVTCVNAPGTFYCGNCPLGYTGNGFQCADIDECEMNNGGCSTAPLVDCQNTIGSRICGPCPAGYVGDGVVCSWVGYCYSNNGGCDPLATCIDVPGLDQPICQCPPGYIGDGKGNGGCQPGGVTCNDNPCVHGRCQSTGSSSYQCICEPGWTGTNCDADINDCQPNPCQNGGTCVDRTNGYDCNCDSSWSGDNCETPNQACGGVYTGETGFFSFPTQGNTYPHGVSCAWQITTSLNMVLEVTFPTFKLEDSDNCIYDFLQIHDGPSASSHQIGKYCGEDIPASITSTHNQLYFWFYSDQSVASDGFSVQWTSQAPDCGEDLFEDFGDISSPGYPGNYPNDRDCVWTIRVSAGNNVQINFATLDIEESDDDCSKDYLEVRDGLYDTSPLLQKLCSTGLLPVPITSAGPYLYIKFHSDNSGTEGGFHLTYHSNQADPGCGGAFTDYSAIIISPNYPNPYQHNAECIWTIEVPQTEVVRLEFTDFEIEDHTNCVYDYVEIRDGIDETEPFAGRHCGSEIPSPFTSTGYQLWIKFKSDVSITGSGFRAIYEVVCGGVFNDETGEIRSPYFPNPYPHDRTCEYVIQQEQGNIVTLTFLVFDVEGHSNCNYDYVEVRDGATVDSPLIGKYCGSSVPAPVSSTGTALYVKFGTDASVSNNGFRASYQAVPTGDGPCGGFFNAPTDSFSSPGYPDTYPHGVTCTYSIQVTPGYLVRLTFTSFSLESHSNCAYDYVEIFDNGTLSLGKYCGTTAPPIMTSSANTMTVVFSADGSVSSEGFTATYVSIDATTACGGTFTDLTGVITSPNYPSNYINNADCIYTITVPSGSQVLLNITDFNLEYHTDCNYDYLEIRNGGYETSPLAGTFCGDGRPNPSEIASHSNRVWMNFKTDASVTRSGFRIEYDGTLTGCGGTLTTPTGSFQSPNYPYAYTHNAECFWVLTASQGSTLILFFNDFDVESHSSCTYDYVKVYDGPTTESPLLGTFCGEIFPPLVYSSGNAMTVKFRADFSIAGRGFQATYHSECDNTLTGNRGVIESPNFPNPYPHNRECTWVIEATLGNTINISFTNFQLEDHSNCIYDYVQIRNGEDETGDEIGRFCGTNSVPGPFSSSGDHLWIKFASDSSVATNGFRLEWVVNGCGEDFTAPTGEFASPNFPDPYPHLRECDWTITVDIGQSIQLTIDVFDLESSSDCRYDVLEVYGGLDASSPLLIQLCHPENDPILVASTGNHMYIRFKSDESLGGQGFHAIYKAVGGGCGGNFTATEGDFHSKNYPNDYDHDTDCTWLISVPGDHSVLLTFLDFEVEAHTSCIYDYVKVYDGPDVTYPLLLTHCGNELPDPDSYQSTRSQMFIHMSTDGSVGGRGFHATYVEGCGTRRDASVDGAITSPNYPDNYDNNKNCTWVLESPNPGDRVTLIFTHMDVEEHDSCIHDSVVVLDGNDPGAPVEGRYCGNQVPPPITSSGSALFVQFISDGNIQQSGFRATYSTATAACGGDYTAIGGSFTSPNYPLSYPHDSECVWTIALPPGNRLQISLSGFNIEYHAECTNDYLEIRENDVSGNVIGRYCGDFNPPIVSVFTSVWIIFRSDSQSTGSGFIGQYSIACGGSLTGPAGLIASLGYPLSYPHNDDCYWTITVNSDYRVTISFFDFDVEDPSNGACIYDYLEIRDGANANAPELARLCGSQHPDDVSSTTNVVYVHFHTDQTSNGRGFYLEWIETPVNPDGTVAPVTVDPGLCGALLTATSTPQTFTSPGYPSPYANDLSCNWLISSSSGATIQLTFNNLDIQDGGDTCQFDHLQIRDGYTFWSPLIGIYCGHQTPDPVVSSHDGIWVQFLTDSSQTASGFSITYQASCGGSLSDSAGVITSPSYPSNYPFNANCDWVVRVDPGTTIQAVVQEMNIQNSASCQSDYLQVLNGPDENAPTLVDSGESTVCGNSPPTLLETSSNQMFVRFVSDGSVSAPGFRITYSTVTSSCGGSLILTHDITSGVLRSPNYPNNYPANTECIWIITAPTNTAIQLVFNDFDFQPSPLGPCLVDYLEVRDGGTSNAQIITRACGTTLPATIRSTGNSLYLKFRSDFIIEAKGFDLTYSIAPCGGHIYAESGLITSPAYPNNYANGLDCEWYVNGPTGHFLTFAYSDLDVVYSDLCFQDYVEIRELNATGRLLGRHCGNSVPPSFDTSDSFAYVRFTSDGSNTATGFALSFLASEEECGGDLTTSSGTFTSPNYPGSYGHSRVCEWRISAAENRAVTLTFNDFNLEDHFTCAYDYVEIRDGLSDDAPSLARYCGTGQIPDPVTSSSNTMKVIFVSDGSVSNGGFSATYTSNEASVCGPSDISGGVGSTGSISSPLYEQGLNYSNNQECVWVINNLEYVNSSIALRFDDDFSIEDSSTCFYDYVEIRLGNSEDDELYDRYCGSDSPGLVLSPYPSLFVKFKTDSSIVDRGFKAYYSFSGCGGLQQGTEGVVTSPNFPADYDHNDNCVWLIQAQEGSQITVTFTAFDIESHPNCLFDYLLVLNGGDTSAPPISGEDPWCGPDAPDSFTSASNLLSVVFITDSSATAGGFRMEWTTLSEGCGGRFHGNAGSFTSPNWPQEYDHNTYCEWVIIAEEGHHLVFDFDDNFGIKPSGGNCIYDYVAVYDGEDNHLSELVGRFCDSNQPTDLVMVSNNKAYVVFRSDRLTSGTGFSVSWSVACGATYKYDVGRVVSPGYPNSQYPSNLDCEYLIDLEPGSMTRISFEDPFGIENHGACAYDYLEMYAGTDSSGLLIGHFCGGNAPDDREIEGPVFLKFHSDYSLNDVGFGIDYQKGCGGTFTGPTGIIQTPTGLVNYNHNENCTWAITVDDNKVVELTFSSFDVEAHTSCNYDYLQVFDGPTVDSPPLTNRLCGDELPDPVRSSANTMLVQFVTDTSVTRAGFVAPYRQTIGSSQGCGGQLNDGDTFGSVDEDGDGQYENRLDCTWIIAISPEDQVATITFGAPFEVETDADCSYDYIEIRDGLTASSPVLAKLCGTSIPGVVVGASNGLYVTFHTDSSVTGAGFSATVSKQPRQCGGSLTATVTPQTLSSPGYPASYPHNLRCRWLIDSNDADNDLATIKITTTALDLQTQDNCEYDYIEYRDYPAGEDSQSARFCGSQNPPDFVTYGPSAEINFVTDATSSGTGFSLQYVLAGCDRVVSGTNGRLTSPGWPDDYPHNAECRVSITGTQFEYLSVYFNGFVIEDHSSCRYDYLKVYDGSDENADLVATMCGDSLPNPIFGTSSSLFLYFKTDSSVSRAGYDLTFVSSASPGCGGQLTETAGSFTSPSWPSEYPASLQCSWLIQVPAGRQPVRLLFTQMDVDGVAGVCNDDVVEIFNGDSETSQSYGRYCGSAVPAQLTASGRSVLVKFTTDGTSSGHNGFRLTYSS